MNTDLFTYWPKSPKLLYSIMNLNTIPKARPTKKKKRRRRRRRGENA
jgi:hypothetical protein